MDLRPSRPLRSPLARLNSNQLRQRDRDHISTLFSPGGGRTTRAASRKIRNLFEVNEDDKIASSIRSMATATSSQGGGGDSGTDAVENATDVAAKPKYKTGLKHSAVSKKKKSKVKKRTSIGRWESWERFEFLRGLRRHGRGHWKKIGESIPTRYAL